MVGVWLDFDKPAARTRCCEQNDATKGDLSVASKVLGARSWGQVAAGKALCQGKVPGKKRQGKDAKEKAPRKQVPGKRRRGKGAGKRCQGKGAGEKMPGKT